VKDLIAKLEAATEGSRELDREVAKAVYGWKRVQPGYYVPRFTQSLDAALTLVPEGWEWFKPQNNYQSDKPRIEIFGPIDYQVAAAATPALAICIAALKAREQQE